MKSAVLRYDFILEVNTYHLKFNFMLLHMTFTCNYFMFMANCFFIFVSCALRLYDSDVYETLGYYLKVT